MERGGPPEKGVETMDGKERYHEYLKSPEWEELRTAAYVRAGGKCELCGGDAAAVHHVRYPKNLKEEDSLDNLVVVCKKCHDRLHGVLGADAGVSVDVSEFTGKLRALRDGLERAKNGLYDRWERQTVKIDRLAFIIEQLRSDADGHEALNLLKYEKLLLEEEVQFAFDLLYRLGG